MHFLSLGLQADGENCGILLIRSFGIHTAGDVAGDETVELKKVQHQPALPVKI